jgi:hypothetical protein
MAYHFSGMRVTVVTLAAGDALERSVARIAGLARQCDALVVVDCDPGGPARAQWGDYAAAGARIIVGRGGGAPAAWGCGNGVGTRSCPPPCSASTWIPPDARSGSSR